MGQKKLYHRYEMFLLNTQIEVKLCCFCFSIYILISTVGMNNILESRFNISVVQVSLLKLTELFDVGAAD